LGVGAYNEHGRQAHDDTEPILSPGTGESFVNLILAVFWGLLALAAFVLLPVIPGQPSLSLGGTSLNVGWLALVFCAYNLLRWFLVRQMTQRQRLLEQRPARRPRREHAESEPNPAFDFSDQRPAPGEPGKPGQ
jgi:hypothetical protein